MGKRLSDNEKLTRMFAAYKKNQAIADKILAEMSKRGASLTIGASASGLRFSPTDSKSAAILRDVLTLKSIKALKVGVRK